MLLPLTTPLDLELPDRLPSPFQPRPHAIAALAAARTQEELERWSPARRALLHGAFGGKMFGVLVVHDADARLGYLQGFAGMFDGGWTLPRFVPPVFDVATFDVLWGTEGATIRELEAKRRVALARHDDAAADLATEQSARSRALHAKLLDLYQLPTADGRVIAMTDLFAPHPVPGGAGDCAGVKLVAYALRHGLEPIAMAEFWWGGPPRGGGRQEGVFYPSCRGRCGVILPHLLAGLDVEDPPDVGMLPFAPDEPRVVHEDASIVVVDKPAGMLSVRGRGRRRRDSVQQRLLDRAGSPDGHWPILVHRLDLATSGLLIAAKSKSVYVALQRQFSARMVEKIYEAVVRGPVVDDRGTIDLPLRKDFVERPRQIVAFEGGKPAVTQWRVLARDEHTTRVELRPSTGRTHQLRLHCAHPEGLGAPIVGDLIYGYGGERLLLHAKTLRLDHPETGERLELSCACPF